MANGYTNYLTHILEAVFGFDIALSSQWLPRHTCLMACVFARALFVDDLVFIGVCFILVFLWWPFCFLSIDPKPNHRMIRHMGLFDVLLYDHNISIHNMQ